MRKVQKSIQDIINSIQNLKGEQISMQVSRGRKRIEKLVGTIENIYPSLFVVNVGEQHIPSKVSCTFSEIMCGNVKIKKISENKLS